jgi:hypothetical protein
MYTSQEINQIFDNLSSHCGLDNVREDMGLEIGDMLLMDETLSEQELALLNLEVTPQIQDILDKALYAVALADVTAWEKERAKTRDHEDYERKNTDLINSEVDVKLEKVSQLQDRMTRGMEDFIQPTSEKLREVIEKMDDAKKGNYVSREQWMALVTNKRTLEANRSKYWELWHKLKAECFAIIGNDKALWTAFFAERDGNENWLLNLINNTKEEELSIYGCTGNTEEVDERENITHDSSDVSDLLADTHIQEMKQYSAPEANGIGFWNFRDQYKTEKRAYHKQSIREEVESLWDSVGVSKNEQFEYVEIG